MEFAQTKGRLLSRTLTEATQSLQDENASLFMITQMSSRTSSADVGELANLVGALDVVASSILGNLNKVITTLEGLGSLTPNFVQGSSRNSASTLTPSLDRPDSPTLSEHYRPSPASSLDGRHRRTFTTDLSENRLPSTGSRPSTSGSNVSDSRRPSGTGISSPLSASLPAASESQEHDEIVDMVSALMRPHLGIRTSLDSDNDEISTLR